MRDNEKECSSTFYTELPVGISRPECISYLKTANGGQGIILKEYYFNCGECSITLFCFSLTVFLRLSTRVGNS